MNRARQEGRADLVLHLLNRRVETLSIDLQDQVKALPSDLLKNLGEDLMDFSQTEDLVGWLDRHGA